MTFILFVHILGVNFGPLLVGMKCTWIWIQRDRGIKLVLLLPNVTKRLLQFMLFSCFLTKYAKDPTKSQLM